MWPIWLFGASVEGMVEVGGLESVRTRKGRVTLRSEEWKEKARRTGVIPYVHRAELLGVREVL